MRNLAFVMCAASMLGAGQAAYGEQSTEMFGDFTAYYIHQDNAYFTDQNKASFVEPIVRVGARAQASEHISLTMRLFGRLGYLNSQHKDILRFVGYILSLDV